MASAADGRGYWLVASDGGIFAFDVPFQGSMPSVRGVGFFPLTLRMRAVPSGNGYLLLGADGSVNAFGTARYFGSAADGAIDLMLAR